jgi:hypothetical protein
MREEINKPILLISPTLHYYVKNTIHGRMESLSEFGPGPSVTSVVDPGYLSRIPDPNFFHPGSRIRTVSIPDPGSASKNLSVLTPKNWFLSSRKYDPG